MTKHEEPFYGATGDASTADACAGGAFNDGACAGDACADGAFNDGACAGGACADGVFTDDAFTAATAGTGASAPNAAESDAGVRRGKQNRCAEGAESAELSSVHGEGDPGDGAKCAADGADLDGDALSEDLASLTQPIEPPAGLKESIMAAVTAGSRQNNTQQTQRRAHQQPHRQLQAVSPPQTQAELHPEANPKGQPYPEQPQEQAQSQLQPGHKVWLEEQPQPKTSTEPQPQAPAQEKAQPRRIGPWWFAAAASVALLVWVGVYQPESTQPPSVNQSHQASEIMQGHQATEVMHEIMDAEDARTAQLDAQGSEISVVVSAHMGKGGAMVNGVPQVRDGMGAQVWSLDQQGRVHSAGVIGPEPHRDVWMPLPADTAMVKITEEPMAGSVRPEGAVLAEAKL